MIKDLADEYFKNLYVMPLHLSDLEIFGNLVLRKFIEDLESSKTTVAWNYGCDSVVFYDDISEIKSKYLTSK
jgi:hypothetical protein